MKGFFMNVKTLALATTLITVPVGVTAATIAAKNNKAETQVIQKTSQYKIDAQDYQTYVLPQYTTLSTPNETLPFTETVNTYLSQPKEKRDSILNETLTKSLAVTKNYNTRMDSIKNEVTTSLEQLSDKTIRFKETDLNKVLIVAKNEKENIFNLYNKMNEIDSITNGVKADKIIPQLNYEEIIENTLEMSLEDFKNTYADEIESLKDKEIPIIEPIPSPYMLTEKERFVLDKINELNNNFETAIVNDYSNIINHTVARSEKTISDVYSGISKLNNFERTQKYSDFEDFVENESQIVVKSFLEEMKEILDNPTGINSAVDNKSSKPFVRKYLEGGKLIIEVTNPKDKSVKRYNTEGMQIK